MSASPPPVTAIGAVPGTIHENARPGDWQASLTLSGGALDLVLAGPDAPLFSLAFDRARQSAVITPAQSFDAEAMGPAVFTLAFDVLTAAGWQRLGQSWQVALLDHDDTPPEALLFVSGGAVMANEPGAVIGTLAATDPDTAGPLHYAVAWPDDAFFTIAGDVLRLRDGIDLLGQGGTTRHVLVTVFDGFHLAAFSLPVEVLAPGAPVTVREGSAAADTLAGTAGQDLLLGLGGADSLAGGDGADILEGWAGADTLDGGAGDDTLEGGEEADRLLGAAGADRLHGAAGQDTLEAGTGHDTLDGGEGADSLHGGDGNDLSRGGDGNDTLHGVAGDDTQEGMAGADQLDGSTGNDLLDGGEGNDLLLGGAGADMLLGGLGPGADSLDGGEGDDAVLGGEGADSLRGGNGADLLSGGEGADTLHGGTGADTLAGGLGDDTYILDAPGAVLIEEPGEGFDTMVVRFVATILPEIERLRIGNTAGNLAASGSARPAPAKSKKAP